MRERGYTLLVVLGVLLALGLAGSTAMMLAGVEAGTANARAIRGQAFAAAEAGLAQFYNVAQPSRLDDEWVLGGAGEWYWLADVPGPSGERLQSRYRVRGDGVGPQAQTARALVEGEVLEAGRVVASAQILVIVGLTGGGRDANTNQEDHGPTGGNADGLGERPISLMNL